MGFLILLRFTLLSIDFLAWPVIALGFPLFASIRAIETSSMYHMRKLVTYWILFSIVSLFEYIFVKIIEWIPFWSCIKLVVIFWLVIPRFHGAYYAYQSFVRPFLVVNLQEAIDVLYKLKKNNLVQEKKFLYLAEKYIEENGYEALENLIATKMVLKEHGESQKDTQVVIEPDEKIVAAAQKQIKEPDYAQKDKEMLEAHEIISPEAKQMELKEHVNSQKDTQVVIEPAQRNVAAAQKQIKEPDTAQKDKEMLEAHEIKSPEAKQVPRPRLLTSTTNTTTSLWAPKGTYVAAKTRDVIIITPPPETSSENSQTGSPLRKDEPEWHCRLCQVKCHCEIVFNSHLQGKKHLNKLNLVNAQETTYAAFVTKGVLGTSPKQTVPETRNPVATPVTPRPEKLVQREWTCSLCKVTTTCENNLNMHLWGKKHKDVLEAFKLTKLINPSKAGPGKTDGPDPGGVSRHWCFACDVELVGSASLASHLNGKRHASNVAKNGIN